MFDLMKKKRFSYLIKSIGTVFLSLACVFGVQAKLRIVTSIFPLEEFAAAVVGERGDVSCLLPPGAEIHSWKPRPSDIVRLSGADLFIYNGAGLEPWMEDILRSLNRPRMKTLDAAAGMREFHAGHGHEGHGHGDIDPHVWLDFEYDQILVDRILDLIVDLDPQGADGYRLRAASYKAELADLDELYRESLKSARGKTFIFGGHAAFGYLAERYNLRQMSLYGLSPNARPKPKQMAGITDFARKNNVKVIFFEQFVSPELARVIADEVGAEIRVLYPGANRTATQFRERVSFLQLMRMNLENLCHGLIRE